MSVLRNAAEKVGTGLLVGVGFGIAAGAIYYVINEKMMAAAWNDKALEKVVVTKHERVPGKVFALILGTVENQSAETLRTLSIQVDLFDKNGKFVDQCQHYLAGGLRAGESRNFKVSCGSKERPVAAHESYNVRVGGM